MQELNIEHLGQQSFHHHWRNSRAQIIYVLTASEETDETLAVPVSLLRHSAALKLNINCSGQTLGAAGILL
jgi:hypothetical protein